MGGIPFGSSREYWTSATTVAKASASLAQLRMDSATALRLAASYKAEM